MTPFYSDDWLTLYGGDCRTVMSEMPADSVDCVVTSPPYWGLRDYGTAAWIGGDEGCDHKPRMGASTRSSLDGGEPIESPRDRPLNACSCGATRQDSQLGLERTPEEYVANLVAVFREVRRVLKPMATVWLNLGDSYADKDLVGIPWRVAFALQADGWYLRSDIIWSKPNPMPESVTDRPTKSHEYLFLLTKSPRYFFDADAVREPAEYRNGRAGEWGRDGNAVADHVIPGQAAAQHRPRESKKRGEFNGKTEAMPGRNAFRAITATRNIRSVWTIATRPYPGAHFAVFPPELPERCIKAGSSERGVCPECGAPWERVVERSGLLDMSRPQAKRAKELFDAAELAAEHLAAIRAVGVTDTGKARVTQDGTGKNTEEVQRLADEAKAALGGYYREFLLDRGQTTGWRPTCTCGSAVQVSGSIVTQDRKSVATTRPPAPAVILDPFAGSGTVGMVANRLSRRAILIDLNPEYLKQQMKRNAQTPLGLLA